MPYEINNNFGTYNYSNVFEDHDNINESSYNSDDNIAIIGSPNNSILSNNSKKNSQSKSRFYGTIEYISPEQIDEKSEDLKGESDYWALGVIIYFLCTRKFPFDDQKNENIVNIANTDYIQNIIDNNINWDRLINSNIDNNLISLVQGLLKYDKGERISSLRECKNHKYFEGKYYLLFCY